MGEEEPESENGLGKNIEHSVSDDLGVNIDIAGSISDTPDAMTCQCFVGQRRHSNLHRVDGPEDQGESGNGAEESSSLLVLVLNNTTTIEGKLVDDDQVGNASHGVPSPFRALLDREGSKETGQDHDHISDNCNEDVGTVQSSEQGKVQKQEWSGDAPVDIAGPIDLAVDGLEGVGEMLLGLLDGDLVLANAIMNGHGVVGDGGESGDEGSQDVEQAFLLGKVSVDES